MNNRLKYLLLPAEIKRRFAFSDFLYYRMQNLSLSEIRQFMTPDELRAAEAALNSDEARNIFNSKALFNKHFSEFLGRETVLLKDLTYSDFTAFLLRHGKIVLKPDNMYAGIGIYVISSSSEGACVDIAGQRPFTEAMFLDLQAKNYLAEEYLIQHSDYAKIYPLSLNTIRVTTLLDSNGEPEILFAANQFGSRGSITDNNDETAIWAVIDTATGIVDAVDIDEKSGLIYDLHPDTGIPIAGFKNPHFDSVKQLALTAAVQIPKCRLIGWDIAVKADGSVCIIEGNVTPELDLYQMISGRGLKSKLMN